MRRLFYGVRGTIQCFVPGVSARSLNALSADWIKKKRGRRETMWFEPRRIKTYRRVREEFMEVISPVVNYATRHEIWDAADRLGLVRKDALCIDESSMELDALQDFVTYEVVLPDPGRFERIAANVPPERRSWLETVRDSAVSVYEITAVDPSERLVILEDRLREGRHELTDLNLSRSAKPTKDVFLALRLLTLEGVTLTSGVMSPVPATNLPNLKGALERRLREGHAFKKAVQPIWCTTFRKRYQSDVVCLVL
jgi:hypothetical protein